MTTESTDVIRPCENCGCDHGVSLDGNITGPCLAHGCVRVEGMFVPPSHPQVKLVWAPERSTPDPTEP